MNIPLSWLREAAQIDDTTPNFIEKMTNSGNAVEGVAYLGKEVSKVVVGKIVSLERHPDADKLWVTQTDVGTGVLQIVTGADNLAVGDYIPVAIHGSTLVNGLKIKKSKMRGLDSNGMLCSISELGYTVADYPEASDNGIYVFPNFDVEKYPLGSDAKIPMELDEEVVDFDVLSNRPDTNCVMGMAREAAAVYNKEFNLPKITLKEVGNGNINDIVSVEIKDSEKCPRYIARVVKNVKVAPSPQWLRRRLSTSGIRPINNIVDITNYVMLEYGQPLHAFDINAVTKKDGKYNIIVRTAKEGETFTTLDGVDRKLNENNLLITDGTKPIGIAGVMGGENSMITGDTVDILFESANFFASNIRQTSRGLGMRTDASARYEKGQDPNQALISVNRAMELIEFLNCGEVVPGLVDVYPNPVAEKTLEFKPEQINKIMGVSSGVLSTTEIISYLNRVGIGVKIAEKIEAIIPSYRADMTTVADLAEEVTRLFGYNNIPSNYTQTTQGEGALPGAGKTLRRRQSEKIKNIMTSLGYYEAITFPFESPKVFDKLLIPSDDPVCDAIKLKNPLGEDLSIMRSLTIDSMMLCISRNTRGNRDGASLFEVGYVYSKNEDGELPNETPFLTFAATGNGASFLSMKGDIESLISCITNRPQVYRAYEKPFLHPGRTAQVAVKVDKNPRAEPLIVGYFGEVHPTVAKNYDVNGRVQIAVFDMNVLHQIAEAYKFKFEESYIFPPVLFDISLKVAESTPVADIEAAIREKGGQLLTEVNLFDVYTGSQVGDGFKSVSYSLCFRNRDRNLEFEEVKKPIDSILENLKNKLGAEIRS